MKWVLAGAVRSRAWVITTQARPDTERPQDLVARGIAAPSSSKGGSLKSVKFVKVVPRPSAEEAFLRTR